MRITSGMLTNNALINMGKNKEAYNAYLEEYTTQKKIQKPSDDPTVAVRSLKYRTNLIEVNQYVEKNIPDATSWMDATEKALGQVNKIYTNLSESCTQAANDTNTTEERANIAAMMKQYKESIYSEQGNSDYVGRYLFTGFRTDVPLLFEDTTTNLSYSIDENFDLNDINNYAYVSGSPTYVAGNTAAQYAVAAPQYLSTHKVTLGYKDLDSTKPVTLSYNDGTTTQTITATTKSITDPTCYTPGTNETIFIPETGEVVFGDTVYSNVKTNAKSGFAVNYTKSEFAEGDIRPEHYYNCAATDSVTAAVKTYSNVGDQSIEYEINFGQKLKVNTLASKAIDTSVGRAMDNIINTINDIDQTQAKIDSITKMIKDGSYTGTAEAMAQLKTQAENQIALQNKMLQEAFASTITVVQGAQKTLNIAVADHGARSKRLDMTANKLKEQKTDFKDALSENEDADLGEAYIKYNEADLLYQATLSATSKILGKSLLDFI